MELWDVVEINIFKIILFCKCRRISLKFVIFLFQGLPACYKKAKILPLATTLIANLLIYAAGLIMF